MKKLQDERGETFIEVLASILITALSVTLMFGCVMASSHMERKAERLDEQHYAALTAAEERTGAAVLGSVRLVNQDNSQEHSLAIAIYGGEGMYSYRETGS